MSDLRGPIGPEDREMILESVPKVFMMDELSRMQETNDRRYNSLSKRITALEESKHGTFDDDNPMRPLLGLMMFGMLVQLLTPILDAMVQRWFSPSSESSR
jgi:hypothetical protein